MLVQPVVSSAAAAAVLGARLSPGLLDKLVARVDFAMRHLSATDVGDLATALAPYSRWAGCVCVWGGCCKYQPKLNQTKLNS